MSDRPRREWMALAWDEGWNEAVRWTVRACARTRTGNHQRGSWRGRMRPLTTKPRRLHEST